MDDDAPVVTGVVHELLLHGEVHDVRANRVHEVLRERVSKRMICRGGMRERVK